MNQTEILAKLQTVFDRIFLDKVVLSTTLTPKEVPEWDSLTHISLLVAVEKAFSIRFQSGEVEKTKNVGEFATLIQTRLGSK